MYKRQYGDGAVCVLSTLTEKKKVKVTVDDGRSWPVEVLRNT